MGKGQRIREQRMHTMKGQFTQEEINELPFESCPKCGEVFKLPGVAIKKVPMTHPKSGGQEGMLFIEASVCLACSIRENIKIAMRDLAKEPYEEKEDD